MDHRNTKPLETTPSTTLQCLFVAALALVLGTACASGLPALITASQQEVAVEFASDGNLGETSKMAAAECEKFGKTAEFIEVQATATPKSRIAKYRCASAEPEPAPVAPAAAATPAAPVAPAATEAVETAETPEAVETPETPEAPETEAPSAD